VTALQTILAKVSKELLSGLMKCCTMSILHHSGSRSSSAGSYNKHELCKL